MFWFFAIVVNEGFSWSPFLAGSYGSCSGIMLHYDPSDISNPLSKVSPLYLNGEYLVEKEMQGLGTFLKDQRTKPIRAIDAISNLKYVETILPGNKVNMNSYLLFIYIYGKQIPMQNRRNAPVMCTLVSLFHIKNINMYYLHNGKY